MNIQVDDIVRLRKKHPCGSDEWKVLQLGVDIRIQCLKCRRVVLLERAILERRIKSAVPKAQPTSSPDGNKSN